jgi:uncharacterized OB-fold protein
VKSERSVPASTPVLEPYFEGARRGVLLIQTCTTCGGHWFPPSDNCPTCLGDSVVWVEASGKASLWSWVVMHQPYMRAFKDEIPYHVAFDKLEEGPLMVSAIVDADVAELRCDLPLTVGFEEMGPDGLPMPVFRPEAV